MLGERFLFYARRLRCFSWKVKRHIAAASAGKPSFRRVIHPTALMFWQSLGNLVDLFAQLHKLDVDEVARSSASFYSILGMLRPQVTETDVCSGNYGEELSIASLTAMDCAEMLSHAEACTHLEHLSWNLFFEMETRVDAQFFQQPQSCLTQASLNLVSVDVQNVEWSEIRHLARCPRLRVLAFTPPETPHGQLRNHPELIEGVSFADLRELRITNDTSSAELTLAMLRTTPSQLELVHIHIGL
jgi:hypothetical protein